MMFKKLLKHRYLIRVLSVHDFRSQYVDSVLGVLWSMLKPLVLIGLYAAVFSAVIASTVTIDGARLNFGLFLFAGMLPWTAVQESVQRAVTVYTDQSSLVKQHTVPLYIYPLAIVISSTISAIFVIVVYIAVKVSLAGGFPRWSFFLLVVIPIQILFCYGLSILVSTLNVFVRDISHVTTTFLAVLFFTSPIIFPPDSLPATAKALMWLNPLTGFVHVYRDILLMDRVPSVAAMASVVLFAACSLLAGVFIYFRSRRQIVDWA